MGRKGLLAVLIAAGLGLVVMSVAADAAGIGLGHDYVFGWEQKLGVAVGATVVWFSSLRLVGWRSFAERSVESTRATRRPAPASG
jgi:hypothetical protein